MVDLRDRVPDAWQPLLADCEALAEVTRFLEREQEDGRAFQPGLDRVFRALELVAPDDVRAVATAQDPYPGVGVPTGVAFSVPETEPLPASLKNIFRELQADLGLPRPSTGDLTPWAQQILMLNAALTCEPGKAGSHARSGWHDVTRHLLSRLVERRGDLVFLCWGRPALRLVQSLDVPARQIVESAHPSPLSAHRGWFGSRPFTRCNTRLQQFGQHPIDWRLP
jgi:uracil-DNA glycosylase